MTESTSKLFHDSGPRRARRRVRLMKLAAALFVALTAVAAIIHLL